MKWKGRRNLYIFCKSGHFKGASERLKKQYVVSSLQFKTHDELLDSKTKTTTGNVGAGGGGHRKFICPVTC